MPKRSSKSTKGPEDLNQMAYRIYEQATAEPTGEPSPEPLPETPEESKNQAAVELGRLGGKKGGAARAQALSPERRSEIAKAAAAKRWGKG